MTEKDLLAYGAAKTDYKLATYALKEFCPAFYSAHVSSLSGLPKDTPPSSPDRLSDKIEEHQCYIDAWRKAKAKMEQCYSILSVAASYLDTDAQKKYLYHRYVRGKKTKELCEILNISRSTAARVKERILEILAFVPVLF